MQNRLLVVNIPGHPEMFLDEQNRQIEIKVAKKREENDFSQGG